MDQDSKKAINFEKTKESTISSTEYNKHMFPEMTNILKLRLETEIESNNHDPVTFFLD